MLEASATYDNCDNGFIRRLPVIAVDARKRGDQ